MPSSAAGKEKIALKELKTRAAAKKPKPLSEQEVRRYFLLDPGSSDPFKPVVRLNPDTVDPAGAKLSPKNTAKLLEALSPKPAIKQSGIALTTAKAAKAAKLKVLTEGDSWFNLPAVIMQPSAIDILAETFDIRNIAIWGDELAPMVAKKQYRQPLKSGLYRRFLFSGGGNDVLGSIETCIKKRKPGDTNPANAASYVKPDFANKLKVAMSDYKTLAKDVRSMGPTGTVLYVHGYANAIPRRNGPYLGKALAEKDFDPEQLAPLARAIVAHMVGLFNDALKAFAAANANVVYVDLRPSMGAGDWGSDEIHPKLSGARKIARAFSEALAQNAPVS